jgi:hypothetical protein
MRTVDNSRMARIPFALIIAFWFLEILVVALVFGVGPRFNNFHSPSFLNFLVLVICGLGLLGLVSAWLFLLKKNRLALIGAATIWVTIAIPIVMDF